MRAAFWAVTSCPRPMMGRGYLPQFQAAFSGAMRGRANLHVFFDVGCELGQALNFVRMLRAGVESGAAVLHTFEDDSAPCVGAFDRVAETPIPKWAAFGVWYSAVTLRTAPGWERAPVGQFYGLQAVTWPRATAIKILEYIAADPWPTRNGGDVIPSKALPGKDYARHVPDLFEHTGAISVCNPGHGLKGFRSSTSWVKDFDARTLGRFR